jgi:hypothetical protein
MRKAPGRSGLAIERLWNTSHFDAVLEHERAERAKL